MPEIKNILIVAPASLKINWMRESEKWLIKDWDTEISKSTKSFPGSRIVIINYEILKKFEDEIKMFGEWDLVIYDESHYLKTPDTIRTKAGLNIKAKRRLFLTGTPILNRPIELWPLLNSVDSKKWNNMIRYAYRYCEAYQDQYGWNMKGSSNEQELQTILRSTLMVRRKKCDVLKDLPPKARQVIEVSAPVKYGEFSKHVNNLAKLKQRVKDGYEEDVEKLKVEQEFVFQNMALIRHEIGVEKVSAVIKYLKEVLESSPKVVCFGWHRDVVEAIAKEFDAPYMHGGTDPDDRQAMVDRFQNDNKCNLIVGGIKVMGVGWTLTKSSHVLFAELDWVPGNLTQAEDRCHRIGQKDSVLVQHLVLDGSIDAAMAKSLVKKQYNIDNALDNEPFNILDVLAKQIKTKEGEVR